MNFTLGLPLGRVLEECTWALILSLLFSNKYRI